MAETASLGRRRATSKGAPLVRVAHREASGREPGGSGDCLAVRSLSIVTGDGHLRSPAHVDVASLRLGRVGAHWREDVFGWYGQELGRHRHAHRHRRRTGRRPLAELIADAERQQPATAARRAFGTARHRTHESLADAATLAEAARTTVDVVGQLSLVGRGCHARDRAAAALAAATVVAVHRSAPRHSAKRRQC